MDGVASGMDMFRISEVMGQGLECLIRETVGYRFHLIIYRVYIVVCVNIDILRIAALRERGEAVEVTNNGNYHDACDGTVEIELRN